jgi:hypothetical protein
MSANTDRRKLAVIIFSAVIGYGVLEQKPIFAPRASVKANDRTRSSAV